MRKLTGKRAVWLGLVATPVLIVAAVATIGVAGSSAEPATIQAITQEPAPVITQTAVSAASVNDYWTPERMANATPMVQTMAASAAQPEIAGDTATGPPGAAGGVTPSGQALPAPTPTGIPQESGGQLPADGPYPGAKVSFKWAAKYTTYPQGTIGKMFFTQDHNGDGVPSGFSCSGAALFIVRLDSVEVAGHCMHNGLNGAGFNGGPGPGSSYEHLVLSVVSQRGQPPARLLGVGRVRDRGGELVRKRLVRQGLGPVPHGFDRDRPYRRAHQHHRRARARVELGPKPGVLELGLPGAAQRSAVELRRW